MAEKKNNFDVSKMLLGLLGAQLETLELLFGVNILVTLSNILEDMLSPSFVVDFVKTETPELGLSLTL